MSDKKFTIHPRDFDGHLYTRPANLTAKQFVEYVKSLPKEILWKKLNGNQGRRFSADVEEASRLIAAEEASTSGK